jgi:O-antigen/teichoic acid export membrane protein
MRGSLRDGVRYALGGFGAGAVISLLGAVVIARFYGATTVGRYALAIAPTNILMITSTAREQIALIRELAASPDRTEDATSIAIATLVFSEALTIAMAIPVMAGTYALYHGVIGHPEILPAAFVVAGVYIAAGNIGANCDSVLSAYKAGRRLFFIRLHEALILPLVAVVLALAVGATLWGLVAAYACAVVLPCIHRAWAARAYLLWPARWESVWAARHRLRELIRWSLKLAPGSVADGAGKEASTWVLGALLPLGQVGAYNRAWLLAARLLDFNSRLVQMLFPALVERRAAGDTVAFGRGLIQAQRLGVSVLLIPATVGLGLAESVMSVFGSGFEAASDGLRFLLFVPVVLTLSSLQGNAVVAHDVLWRPTLLVIGRTLLILAFLVALTPRWGIAGAGAALLSAHLLELFGNTWLLKRVVPHVSIVSSFGIGRLVIAVALGAAAGWAVQRSLGVGIVALVIGSAFASAAFVGSLMVTRWVKRDDVKALVFDRG